MEEFFNQHPIAFLVDGDNVSADLAREMLAEASKYGSAVIRKVYGDWSQPTMQKWRVALKDYGMEPVQQFPNVAGKNATDSALIIDAMDILHDGIVKGFVIVSSDSDYTSLARRIRAHGIMAIGMGEEKTHPSFRNACDRFVLLDNLRPQEMPGPAKGKAVVNGGQPSPSPMAGKKGPAEALDMLTKAFDNADSGQGRVMLSNLGVSLINMDPGFDPRTFGRKKLINLIEELPDHFVVESDKKGGGAVYIKKRDKGTRRAQSRA